MPTPVVGDTVLHRDRAFEIRDFPPKLGLPDGAAYEAVRVMDAADEAAWEAAHLTELTAAFLATEQRQPTEDDAAALARKAKLRPMQPRALRDGSVVTPNRLMRTTGLVADLRAVSAGLWQVKTAADHEKEAKAAADQPKPET